MCAACAGAGNAKRDRERRERERESADEQLAACPCVYANARRGGRGKGKERACFSLSRGVHEPPPAVSVSIQDRVCAAGACICNRGKAWTRESVSAVRSPFTHAPPS